MVTMAGGGGLGGGGPRGAGVLPSLSNNDVKGGRAIGSSLVIRRPTSLTVRRPCPSVSTVTCPLKLLLTIVLPSSKAKVPSDSGIQTCLRPPPCSCCGGGGGGGGGGGEGPLVRTGCNTVRRCDSGGCCGMGGCGGGGGGGGGGDLGLKALTGPVAKK